jgi:hypothetical protein
MNLDKLSKAEAQKVAEKYAAVHNAAHREFLKVIRSHGGMSIVDRSCHAMYTGQLTKENVAHVAHWMTAGNMKDGYVGERLRKVAPISRPILKKDDPTIEKEFDAIVKKFAAEWRAFIDS